MIHRIEIHFNPHLFVFDVPFDVCNSTFQGYQSIKQTQKLNTRIRNSIYSRWNLSISVIRACHRFISWLCEECNIAEKRYLR